MEGSICKRKSYVDAGSEIKFADFLREILLTVTLEPFTQTECSFHQTKHTSFLKQKKYLV